MAKTTITQRDIEHLSKLAKLDPNSEKKDALKSQLETSFEYINIIQQTDTSQVEETNQVTGLRNVFREDEIDTQRTLTQEQALKNAPNKHNGYFMVPAILE